MRSDGSVGDLWPQTSVQCLWKAAGVCWCSGPSEMYLEGCVCVFVSFLKSRPASYSSIDNVVCQRFGSLAFQFRVKLTVSTSFNKFLCVQLCKQPQEHAMEHFLVPSPVSSPKGNPYFEFYIHRLVLLVLELHKNGVMEYVLFWV